MYPEDLRYTKNHEWARVESDGTGVVGITHFAQDELGDIVFVDLPSVGTDLDQSAKFGEIESVKTVSDLFMPIAGKVIEVNNQLRQQPELVNRDPYGSGWLVKVEIADPSRAATLLTAEQYQRTLPGR